MSNYEAVIAKVGTISPIVGADFIKKATVLGESVVVSKDVQVGDIGVLFVTGTQLSEQYCYENNLYRHKEKNKDQTKAGFFDDNRKVRTQTLRGSQSDAYFAPLDSLAYTGYDISKLQNDKFTVLNGFDICKKYISPQTLKAISTKAGTTKQAKASLTPLFKEHIETAQFRLAAQGLVKGDLISIQAKVHGTSTRSSYTKVLIELPKWKQFINKIYPIFPTEKYDYVTGTRRVVLKTPTDEGFHGSESFRFEITEKLKPYLSKGMTVYGEAAGYVNGKPIMGIHSTAGIKDKDFKKKYGDFVIYEYGCNETEYRFHIYRITITTDDGVSIDFTQPQLVAWCKDRGFTPAYDIVEPFIYDGDEAKLRTLIDDLTERRSVLTEDYIDPSHPSEGVIIRVDRGGLTPLFLKSKSFAFRVLEGIASDDSVDTEDAA